MKSQPLYLLLCLFFAFELSGQSYQEAFHPHYALAQRAPVKNASSLASQPRLSSSVSVGYQPGISVKEEPVGRRDEAVTSFHIAKGQKTMTLKASLATEDIGKYHLLLTSKKGAFLENFPLQQSTKIDCKHLRSGSYKILLCSRDQSEPIRQFKLTKY
ncbi:MAG: hypothetical protein HRU41_19040 [Saprospiraceae bacterium]|nr:hypothetical protein [Saprospiraceae bacterium]